jgi:hypothetical protein
MTLAANALDGPDVTTDEEAGLAGLLGELRRHAELDLDTLGYHAEQSDATARDGYWHASVNEARSFLEALLVSMLHMVRPDPPDNSHNNGSHNGAPFRCYRRCLMEAGFLDADENELLQFVYSVASAKGSHAGVTDASWSRLARRMVFTTAQYLIQHYETWKAGGARESPADRDPRSCVTAKSRWRRWLSRVGRVIDRTSGGYQESSGR